MSFDEGAQIITIFLALTVSLFGGWAYMASQLRKIDHKLESYKLYSANNFVTHTSAEKTEHRLISVVRELTVEVRSLRDSFLAQSSLGNTTNVITADKPSPRQRRSRE